MGRGKNLISQPATPEITAFEKDDCPKRNVLSEGKCRDKGKSGVKN